MCACVIKKKKKITLTPHIFLQRYLAAVAASVMARPKARSTMTAGIGTMAVQLSPASGKHPMADSGWASALTTTTPAAPAAATKEACGACEKPSRKG